MGRAPNSGAPQRVSAHVVPKAPSFSSEDEDDKTTIESGWEEEASTTVEQGDVAERIRSLSLGEPKRRSGTNITSTDGGSMSDEPTVDEARANIALALPPTAVARLVITGGNDAGQELEVRPGKTYTIGRSIDNDLVLTDIAVSRKHFDVRHDNGAWVLADRGSGNGTLVNARIEDAPFMLASGDVIEIGNTAFRFDLPNGAPRTPVPAPPAEPEPDDELEMSTVSGKPFRELEAPTPPEAAAPVRPKPPPPQLPRPRTPSNRSPYTGARPQPLAPLAIPSSASTAPQPPIVSMPGPGPHTLHLPQPSSTMPLPQMANRTPLAMGPSGLVDPAAGSMPPTLLGGQSAPLPVRLARLPFASYAPTSGGPPGTAEIPTQRSPNGARSPLQVAASPPGRDATLTAQVLPMGYNSNAQAAVVPPPGYVPPLPISRQAKMVLAGIGIAVFAAVATIAIIKGARGSKASAPVNVKPVEPGDAKPPRSASDAARPAKPVVTPIAATPAARPTTTAPTTATTAPPLPTTATTAPPLPTTATTAPPLPTTTTTTTATTPVRIAVSPAPTAPVAPPTTTAPAPVAATPPPTTAAPAAPVTASTTQALAAKPTPTPAVPTPAPVAATPPPTAAAQPARIASSPRVENESPRAEKKPTPRPDRKPAEKKPTVASLESAKPDRRRGRSTQDVKSDASTLYRNKNFSGAAGAITAALPSFSGGDAQDLRNLAAIYSQLGKAYNVGMAPGTKPTEGYQALRRAISYDREVGSAFVGDLQDHLVTVASRAAVSYMASKELESAFQAVRTAESLGSTSSSNKPVRDKLEATAGELFRAAQSELSSDPDSAKKKLRQILGIVDPKHPTYAKAQKLLNAP